MFYHKKKNIMENIPEDVIVLIIYYLDHPDIRNFYYKHKYLRNLIERRGLLEFKLNNEYSLFYYNYRLYNFRNEIENRNAKIIKLNLCNTNESLYRFEKLDELGLGSIYLQELDLHNSNIEDISILSKYKHLKKVDLYGCDMVQDITSLKNIEELDIIDCFEVIDISCLKKLRKLSLVLCDIKIGINILENVSESLTFSHCLKCDWNHNEHIYKLTAEFMNKIKAPEIEIIDYHNNNQIFDISILLGRHRDTIKLQYLNSNDLSPLLSKVRRVELRNMSCIIDVSPLRYCKEVLINNCDKITDISSLKNVSKLTIINCNAIQISF